MADELDLSDDLNLVVVFKSKRHDAEMEALAVRGVLDAGGIPSVLVGPSVLPMLTFEVRVPKERREDAEALITESRAIGPEGADEAERASESA